MGVQMGTAQVTDYGCAAVRWSHWWEPHIWGNGDNVRIVDGNGIPAWGGAEYHAGRLGGGPFEWACTYIVTLPKQSFPVVWFPLVKAVRISYSDK